MVDNWLLGGLQEHQQWRNDGICTCLTSAMGMGGGYIPLILEQKNEKVKGEIIYGRE